MEEIIYSHRRFGTVKNGECSKVSKIQNRSALIESEGIMDKLAELNKMEVVDYSISSNEVEYVAIENNEENRQVLLNLGTTEEDLLDMAGGDADSDTLDISYFAFSECDAGWWSKEDGFGYDE